MPSKLRFLKCSKKNYMLEQMKYGTLLMGSYGQMWLQIIRFDGYITLSCGNTPQFILKLKCFGIISSFCYCIYHCEYFCAQPLIQLLLISLGYNRVCKCSTLRYVTKLFFTVIAPIYTVTWDRQSLLLDILSRTWHYQIGLNMGISFM